LKFLLARISFASLLGLLFTALKWSAIMFFGMATWAQLRSVEVVPPNLRDWLWWVLVAAAVFAAIDPGAHLRSMSRRFNTSESKSNLLVRALHLIRLDVTVKKKVQVLRPAHEGLLQAAALELRAALGIAEEGDLKTNLIVAAPPERFRVIARSRPGSPLEVEYTMTSETAVSGAIKGNRTVVVSDVKPLRASNSMARRLRIAERAWRHAWPRHSFLMNCGR